ncbi:MAG: hypothetical protein IJY07_03080, partial [Clostridia bacterium]|nr:hypothetical protein [Clostridia bacterium]
MAENTNLRNNFNNDSMNNIKKIDEFLKRNQASVLNLISNEKRKLDDAKQDLKSKKMDWLKELEERKALEEARLKQEKEIAEAIKAATAQPIIEAPVVDEPATEEVQAEEVVEAVEVKEEVVEVPAPEVKEEAPAVEEAKPVQPVVVAQTPQKKPQADEKQNQKQINAAKAAALQFLAKPKKQSVEKPVIRVYIPPVEEHRPKRNERPQQGGQQQYRDKNANQQSGGMNTFQRQNTIEHLNNTPVLQKDTQKKKVFDNTPEEKTFLGKKAKLKKGLDGGGRAAV